MRARLHRSVVPKLENISETVRWIVGESPDWVDRAVLDTGLTEALTNAVVHGALGVASSGRGEDITVYLDELERRLHAPEAQDSRVSVSVARQEEHFQVALAWTGAACPKENQLPPSSIKPLTGSGLGTTLIHTCFDEVHWGEDGRSVKLCLIRQRRH